MKKESHSPKTIGQVKLPGHCLRSLASALHSYHRPAPPPPCPLPPITVVCISDTHNTQPPIPPGDLLLHAGDLSVWGSFPEIQAQITWLSQQSHRYKVVIAGNHDLLLDSEFCRQFPRRWEEAMSASSVSEEDRLKSKKDLEWGGVIYLENSSVCLDFAGGRQLSIYGSPLTPEYSTSAFQYPRSEDIWKGTIPSGVDIALTHGPPRGYLDGLKNSGCIWLAQELLRVRPRLVVFGHIHVGYGTEEQTLDRAGKAHGSILGQWGNWFDLLILGWSVFCSYLIPSFLRRAQTRTAFVNVAVVEGWHDHKIKNSAVILDL